MKVHWVYFLEDAGEPLKRRGNDQYNRGADIINLQNKIERLKSEYQDKEAEIFESIRELWTIEEIAEAKFKFKNQTQK